MDQLSLMCRDTDFPPMSLDIYATPGRKNKSNGHKPSDLYMEGRQSGKKSNKNIIDLSRILVIYGTNSNALAINMRSAPEAERKST